MPNRFLPDRFDNTYQGARLALWLFGLLLLAKAAMGLNVIFNGYVVARNADGIPLESYAPAAARAVVTMIALWGVGQLVLALLGLLALTRYRAMVPLLFGLMLLEHLARRGILLAMPIARAGRPPGTAVNLVLLAVMVVGLALSLQRAPAPPPTP